MPIARALPGLAEAALALGLTIPVASAAADRPRDITAYVKRHTVLDEATALACLQYCQGNQREGRLDRLSLQRARGSSYRVTGEASFRNRQVTTVRSAKVVVFDFTVIVHALGSLDPASCKLRVDKVWIENDRLGLTPMAEREEGKVVKVAACRQFIVAAGYGP